ncbi:MAG TPA: hypothetical protein VNX68_15140 [Nitrosopumilaceae archaeon]|jgi:hypothetical protein|nr:hypothetical protein [Nitrosopumilaceae archaeon]
MPNNTPILVTGSVTSVASLDAFTRLQLDYVLSTEEVRWDLPASYANAFTYKGIAPSGSPTSSPVWQVVRVSFNNIQRKTREQFQANIAWDNRANGW